MGGAFRHLLLRVYGACVVGLLFLPLAVMALMSLKASSFVGFPLGRLTLGWYGVLVADSEMRDALAFSVAVAMLSSAAALLIGTWTALAIDALPPGLSRLALIGGAVVPLVTPGIVAAISLRMFIRVVGLEPGMASVALGHAVQAAPYVTLILAARLRAMPGELLEAARDLGAGEAQAFAFVTLPYLRPAMQGAFVLAVLLSFDDFLRAFFLGGYRATLPVLIYGRLDSGLSPEINAAATLLLVVSVAAGLFGEGQLKRAYRRVAKPSVSGSDRSSGGLKGKPTAFPRP